MVGVITPFLFIAVAAGHPDVNKRIEERRQEEKIAADKLISDQVKLCLDQKGPWKCYEALMELDEEYPVENGQTRLARFVSLTTAQEVLELCDLPRRVDCANKMFGGGYKSAEIQQALKDVGELPGVDAKSGVTEGG